MSMDLVWSGRCTAAAYRRSRWIPISTKPTAATRFPRKIRISSLAGPEFISELLELQPRLGKRPFLILTHEESVATISLEREKLAGKYLFSMPSHAVMTELLDKCGFQALAERLGFPIPRAVRVTPALGTEATRDLGFLACSNPRTSTQDMRTALSKPTK